MHRGDTAGVRKLVNDRAGRNTRGMEHKFFQEPHNLCLAGLGST